jgi:hypothetical protein
MVCKMIEKQYSYLMRGPPHYYHPEIIAVQYILPCFVASYLELENTDESNKVKIEYLRFVHELVKSYEQSEYCFELTQATQKQEYFDCNEEFLFNFYTDIEENYDKSCTVFEHMGPFCREHVVNGLNNISAFNKIPESRLGNQSGALSKCDYSWFYKKYMIFNRIYASLDKLGKIPLAPLYYGGALGTVFSNIVGHSSTSEPTKLSTLASILTFRMVSSAVKINDCEDPPFLEPNSNAIYRDFQVLSDKQLFHLVYFQFMNDLVVERSLKIDSLVSETFQRQYFPLDLYGKLFWCIVDRDWWKLKIIASKGNVDKDGEDLSLIPFSLARKSHNCRELLLKVMSRTGKLHMSKPGAITFFPIKHCRWCGLAKSKTLVLCRECKENHDYPDRNYFCSEECQTECLKKQHIEEHAQFLLMQLENEI